MDTIPAYAAVATLWNQFIAGWMPSSVSVYGILDKEPNGRSGCLWTDARVPWEYGAFLNVQSSLSVPDAVPGLARRACLCSAPGAAAGRDWITHPPASPVAGGIPRHELIADIDGEGLLATPCKSRYSAAVCEAARISIRNRGSLVELDLRGA